MDGRQLRLSRLMSRGRAVVVAIDHGMFDGPIPGMEDLPATASKINPQVDAVLLAPGMIRHCSEVFTDGRGPLAMVRLNFNTVYCFGWAYREAHSVPAYDVEDALREGMDIALVSLTLQTGSEQRDAANVEIFCRLVNACHRLGVPVVGEYFPTGHLEMTPHQLHENVRMGCRIVAELGADAIKTFNTEHFQDVTRTCPVPVLGLGAEKLPTQEAALALAESEVKAGAGGVVFGRNAIQVPHPDRFQAALCDVVWHGTSAAEAAARHNLVDAVSRA